MDPDTQNPEHRTQNPEPRTQNPNPEPRTQKASTIRPSHGIAHPDQLQVPGTVGIDRLRIVTIAIWPYGHIYIAIKKTKKQKMKK